MKKKEDPKPVKKTVRKKKTAEPVKEPKSLEITYIYHEGDNIHDVAEAITGHAYLAGALLYANNKSMNTLKEGDVLKWK